MWQHIGSRRPSFAVTPGPGQESVWDYPRPPRLEPDRREVVIRAGGFEIARTAGAMRVLETASPPTFYLPPAGIIMEHLRPAPGSSFCEWKGVASYWALRADPGSGPVAWSYPEPSARFEAIRGWLSFYPGRVECLVDGERVRPQPGGFYGGWVTAEIVGPFKGDPGTGHW